MPRSRTRVRAGRPPGLKGGDRGSALEKALATLEAMAEQPQAVGLPDLTARLGLPRQTVHRLLRQLEAHGLVLRDPSRERFSIGPRFSSLALKALSSRNQEAPVRAVLAALVNDVGETCNVGVLDGLEFVYLARIECQWSLRVHLTAGSRVPAYCTSGGKVMLAHLDPELRAGLLKNVPLRAYTPQTMTRPAVLERQLAQIRKQGFALNNEEFTVGIVGVAVPIVSGADRVLGALALHGPRARLSLAQAERHVPRLREAAAQIAEVWGLVPEPRRDKVLAG